MMYRTLLITILAVTGSANGFCQSALQVTASLGPEIEHKGRYSNPEKALGSNEHGFFVQREAPANTVSLERYSKDLRLADNNSFELSRNGEKLELWYTFTTGELLYVLGRSLDKSSDIASFYVCEIDPRTLDLKGDWATLGEVDTKGRKITLDLFNAGYMNTTTKFIFGSKERGTDAQYNSVRSPNDEKSAFFTEYATVNDEPDVFDLWVVDKYMKEQWKLTFSLRETQKEWRRSQVEVGDDGVVFISGRKYHDGGEAVVKGKPNYVQRIYAVNSEGVRFETTLDLGEKFIKSSWLEQIGDALYLTGYYAEDKSFEARGVYLCKIDRSSGKILTNVQHPFSQVLLEEAFGEKKGASLFDKMQKNQAAGVEALDLMLVEATGNGGVRITGEQDWIQWYNSTRELPGGGTSGSKRLVYKKTSSIPIYHSEHILSIQLAADGMVMNQQAIKKEQAITHDGSYHSFIHLSDPASTAQAFLFNDNLKNLDPEKLDNGSAAKWTGGKGCVSMVKMSGSDQQRTSLLDIKEEETALYPTISIVVSPREKLVLCRHKDTERWLQLKW